MTNDDLATLGHLVDAVEAICKSMSVVVDRQDQVVQDDLYPALLVVTSGAGAMRQALGRELGRNN